MYLYVKKHPDPSGHLELNVPGPEQNVLKQLLIPRSATVERVWHPEKNLRSIKTVSSFKSEFVTLLFTLAFQISRIICLFWFLLYLNAFSSVDFCTFTEIITYPDGAFQGEGSVRNSSADLIFLPSFSHTCMRTCLSLPIIPPWLQNICSEYCLKYCRYLLSFSPSRLQPLIQMPDC